MKKSILFIILSICLASNCSYSQNNNYNWISPNKTYLKLLIAEDGIYRITKQDFQKVRLETNAIDPRTVKVLYKGNEVPIFFQGEKDKTFNDSDYFDFYATRNYGGLTKVHNVSNQVLYSTDEYYNQYSDTNIYWIEWGGSFGQRISVANYNYTYQPLVPYFYEKIHFEKDLVYSFGADGIAFNNFMTERFKGEGYYWALLFSDQSITDTFSIPDLYTGSQNASIRVVAYPFDASSQYYNEHKLRVSLNPYVFDTIKINDFRRVDTTFTFPSSYLSNSSVNSFKIKYLRETPFFGSAYVDLVEINYPRKFQFNNKGKLSFGSGSTDTSLRLFSVSNYNNFHSPPISIYDVSKNLKINGYSTNSDTLNFKGKTNSKFEIVSGLNVKKPKRIYVRHVPNLVTNSTGADYLIIYNRKFSSQAEQLKNYRVSHDNFRTYKAEIEDIYDIFNYGLEDPFAVRNFLKNVYDNWPQPKLKYICLFGRGSLDPKKSMTESVYYQNLVPVYGAPPSDGYFANLNSGSYFYFDQIAIGRLPAYTVTEAQNMVDNIITYENQNPGDWWKSYIFIAGGSNLQEQIQRQTTSNNLINSFVSPVPVSGNAHKIYRNDTSSSQTFNYADSIKNDINRGATIVNFVGHASSQVWDLGLYDPNVLNNSGKLPFVFSMTCYTGKNAETNQRFFGESFIGMNNKGAIGFIGTTGWSFDFTADELNGWIFKAIKDDTLRRFGDIIKKAQKNMSPDSLFFSVQHTVNCYNLLGDPACKLALPKQPEFYIGNTDYKLSNDFPSINEPATLLIYPKNFGLNADSCKIRFQLKKNNLDYSFKDTVLRNLKYSDTAKYYFVLDSSGNYSINVNLDFANWYTNENEINNTIIINLNLKNTSFIPLKPVNNSVVKTDSIEFTALNPMKKYIQNNIKVILQFDTTKLFNSQLNRTFVNNNISGAVTKFKTSIPVLNQNKIYYWRTNAIINNDSTGWSRVQMFIYNTNLNSPTEKSVENIEIDNSSDTGAVTLSKSKSNQYNQQDFSDTYFAANGIKLIEYTGNLFVRSLGSNGAEASYFSVNDKNIFIDGGSNTGLNMIKVKKINGSIVQFKNFKMTYPNSSDSVLSFLNTFDTTYYLMVLNASYVIPYPSFYSFNTATKQKMRQFGSVYADSIIQFGTFHTWSFVGFPGALPNQAAEDYHLYVSSWIQSTCLLSPTFKKTSGTVSNIIGPAQSWKDFSWQRTLLPLSNILFDVVGIDKNGLRTTILTNQNTNQLVNLNSINSYQYPQLDLLTKFSIDTINGNQSSILNSLKIHYTPPAEIAVDYNSFTQTDTVLKYGDELKIQLNYYNAGYVTLPGIIVNIYRASLASQNILKSDTINRAIEVDSSLKHNNKFIIPRIRIPNGNKALFYVEVIPKGQFNEFYTYNNSMSFSVAIANNSQSLIELYSNGQLVTSGDYVSSNPELKVTYRLAKLKSILKTDTTQIIVKLNESFIPYFTKGITNPDLKISDNEKSDAGNESSNTLLYYPKLNVGVNNLSIIYKDESDNIDTVKYDLLVSDEISVSDLYNYPNPMKSETKFIFNLLSSNNFNPCKIKIYTVAGRLINEIKASANIGNNQISWDGKDSDGDYISNGTYLYKLIIEDDKKIESTAQKLVVLK